MQKSDIVRKPGLSFWQIWNMCIGFMGIQFGFALQNANISRIFQTLGAPMEDIPILWVAAPLTGLLVQPIIGYMSDRTWGRFGRRKPYFFVGAVLSTAALFYIPNSPTLWIAAGMLWILDASINISMEPFRALVGDMLPEKQRTLGYAMQSFFISAGSVVASALPWIMTNYLHVSNTAPEGVVPLSVKVSFYTGGAFFLMLVAWSSLRTREYSPQEQGAFSRGQGQDINNESVKDKIGQSFITHHLRGGVLCLLTGVGATILIAEFHLNKELYILSIVTAVFGGIRLIVHRLVMVARYENALVQITHDIFRMPEAMKQLAFVQFFSWLALFAVWTYTTPAVTQFHYMTTDPTSSLYNEGADWVGILFAAYNTASIFAAIFIAKMSRRMDSRRLHCLNLCIGGFGLVSFYFVPDPSWLVGSMAAMGFAWASILSIPYSLLSTAIPQHKMGTYMGIFNLFIVIPQILAATLLGLLLSTFFGGQAIWVIVLAGVSMIVAGVLSLRVKSQG